MLAAARHQQQPAVGDQQVGGRQQAAAVGRQPELRQRPRVAGVQAVGQRLDRHARPAGNAHEAVPHGQLRVLRRGQRRRVGRQAGPPQIEAGVAFGARNPLHMLVALAGARGRAAVVKTQPAGSHQHARQRGEVAAVQRFKLLAERLRRDDEVARRDRKLVQDRRVRIAQRPDGERRIGREKRVEVRITRAAGNQRALARQRGHRARQKAQAAIDQLGLFGDQGLQVARGQGALGAFVDLLQEIARHGVPSEIGTMKHGRGAHGWCGARPLPAHPTQARGRPAGARPKPRGAAGQNTCGTIMLSGTGWRT